MTRLDEIPTAFEPPVDAQPSAVLARIRSIRPSRRAVLRGLLIGAAATALVPFDWYLARRAASAQEGGSTADRSEHMSCRPASYDEEANNWPAGGAAVCYGGWRRGSFPCSGGYHREGSFAGNGERYTSTRVTTSCHGKNAWRWNGYRCSDAMTTAFFEDGTEYSALTIAACALSSTESSGGTPDSGASGETPEAATPGGGASGGETSGGETSGSGTSDGGTSDGGTPAGTSTDTAGDSDPRQSRQAFPDLGLGVRSFPGLGAPAGR